MLSDVVIVVSIAVRFAAAGGIAVLAWLTHRETVELERREEGRR